MEEILVPMLRTLVTSFLFILFDVLTGLLKAAKTTGYNSTKMSRGGLNKLAELMTLIGAFGLQFAVEYVDLGFSLPSLPVVAGYICLMELISIMENLGEVNPELGKLFSVFLEKLRNKDDGDS